MLRRINLLHIGRVIFNFHFPKNQHVFIRYVFLRLVDMSMTPQTHYSWFWVHQMIQISPRKINNHFGKMLLSQNLCMLEKTRAGKCLRSVVSILENLEYGINIFQKTRNGNFVFLIQLKESLPPTHPSLGSTSIPIPTPASEYKHQSSRKEKTLVCMEMRGHQHTRLLKETSASMWPK